MAFLAELVSPIWLQVKLDDIDVIVVEVVVKAMVEVEVQLLFRLAGWMGGLSDKFKLILISNLVEVELGNDNLAKSKGRCKKHSW